MADDLRDRAARALERPLTRAFQPMSARAFESTVVNDLLYCRAVKVLDERKFNPTLHPHDPHSGKWIGNALSGVQQLATGTRMTDLSPKGRAAVTANDAKFGVTREALEAAVESKLTAESIAKGRSWFPDARAFNERLAKRSGLSVEQATAITAATSPRTPWPQNMRLAERIALTHKQYPEADARAAAKRMGGGMSMSIGAGIAIARGGSIDTTLTGTKRRSFYNNMLRPGMTDDVTVDTWMQRAVMAASSKSMSLDDSLDYLNQAKAATNGVGAGYVSIAEAVRAVAERHGISPDEAQSAYWVTVTGSSLGQRPGKA